MIKNFLNPEGHQNPINGSEVIAILLKGWILPIGIIQNLNFNNWVNNESKFQLPSMNRVGMGTFYES